MHLRDISIALDHKIVSGSDYQWDCFGENARWLDFETEHGYTSVVFDSKNQMVYTADVTNVEGNKNYKFIDSLFYEKYVQEAKLKNVNPFNLCDNIDYIILEVDTDFIEKATAIMNGKEFDKRVSVPVNLDDFELLHLCLEAHKRDVTLNKMIEIILQDVVDKNKPNLG